MPNRIVVRVTILDPVAIRRVRAVAAHAGLEGVVLTTPGAVAWATGGLNTPIDRSAPTDTIWVAIGRGALAIVTTNVEAPRLAADFTLDPDCSLVSVPWWEPEQMARSAAAALDARPGDLGTDGHAAFGHDLGLAVTRERLALTPTQQQSLADLARVATAAVQTSLRTWRPGESDRTIAGRIAGSVEQFGGQCPVLLVGADDRVERFRHPVAVGASATRLVMAVLVAARGGQHVALTRYASAGPIDAGLAAGFDRVRGIQRSVLRRCTPGASVGEVMTGLGEAYAACGHAGAWRDHYQGGPIGYTQRECEIAPGQADSPWWDVVLPAGCAVAFNPSIAGGAKDEDTYLVTDDGPRWLTSTGADWPTTTDHDLPRPAVLDIEN